MRIDNMNFTKEEERIMIVRRFCYDIERDGVSAGLIEQVSPTDDYYGDQMNKEEIDETLEKIDKAITEIINQMDSTERVENLINQDGYTPLFPWFYGQHYTVSVDDGIKKVTEKKADDERDRIKNNIQSFIDEDENFLSLLRAMIEKGGFGEIDHEMLISDKLVVDFPYSDGSIEIGSDEKEAKILIEDGDGWSRYFILSSSTSLQTSNFEKLNDIDGFYVFIDETSSGLNVCKVLVAGEIVSLIDEVLKDYQEDESPTHQLETEVLDIGDYEFSNFNEIIKKRGWNDVINNVVYAYRRWLVKTRKKEYVEVSEEYAEKRISNLESQLENPNRIYGNVGMFKKASKLKSFLHNSNISDFNIDSLYWDPEGMDSREIGHVMDIPPRGHDQAEKGYMVIAQSVDEALMRINRIVDSWEQEDYVMLYFKVVTPEQPSPIITNLDWYEEILRFEIAEWEEAKRTGKVSKGLKEK